jgi:hypothetical protein
MYGCHPSKKKKDPKTSQSGYKLCAHKNGVLPSARGCCASQGPYLTASFLYWKAAFSNLTPAAFSHAQSHDFQNIKTPYAPGAKVGLGYNLPGDGWDLFLNWTWLHSHSHLSMQAKGEKTITVFSELIAPSSFTATRLHSHGTIALNVEDLELGRNFFVGNSVSLRPFGGVKAFYLKHSIKTNYTTGHSSIKDQAWGIGPRMGVSSRWALGSSHVAFLLNAAGSLVWEDMHPTSKITLAGTPILEGKSQIHARNINPIGELFIGLDGGGCIKKWFYINMSIGYEVQYWAHQIPETPVNPINNSLSLQGLTASLKLDF